MSDVGTPGALATLPQQLTVPIGHLAKTQLTGGGVRRQYQMFETVLRPKPQLPGKHAAEHLVRCPNCGNDIPVMFTQQSVVILNQADLPATVRERLKRRLTKQALLNKSWLGAALALAALIWLRPLSYVTGGNIIASACALLCTGLYSSGPIRIWTMRRRLPDKILIEVGSASLLSDHPDAFTMITTVDGIGVGAHGRETPDDDHVIWTQVNGALRDYQFFDVLRHSTTALPLDALVDTTGLSRGRWKSGLPLWNAPKPWSVMPTVPKAIELKGYCPRCRRKKIHTNYGWLGVVVAVATLFVAATVGVLFRFPGFWVVSYLGVLCSLAALGYTVMGVYQGTKYRCWDCGHKW